MSTTNQEVVKELMEQAAQIKMGSELQSQVELSFKGSDGKDYTGIVTFKKPTMMDYLRMGALKAEYLRTAGVVDIELVDRTVKQLAQVMATLKTTIKEGPAWLINIDVIDDIDLLYYVYDKYEAWELSFRRDSN